ncbi:MAG: hypothetical protein EOP04_27190, partial [Proteobacteria bacterium]
MTNHLKGEQGSTAFTVTACLVTIGLALASVQKMHSLTKQSIDDNRISQSRETVQGGAMNSLALLKSLLSTRKQTDGRYVPALYATNYFATEWTLTTHPDFKIPPDFVLHPPLGGTFSVASSKSLEFPSVAEIMEGKKLPSPSKTAFKVRIVAANV